MKRLKLSKNHLYSRGAARFEDLVYLSIKDRRLDRQSIRHSRLVSLDGGEGANVDDVEWATAGMCVVKRPAEKLVVVSPSGQVLTYVGGDQTSETITPEPFELKACRAIVGYAYACGMKRQVYRRAGEGRWTAMHAPEGDGRRVYGFEAIDGFSEEELYAVGWNGEIWQRVKTKWSERSSPVNRILTAVVCADDGIVYAAGQHGTLVVGRRESWRVLKQDDVIDDFWDLCWFNEKLYVAAMSGLYQLDGEDLVPVDFGKDAPRSCYKLTAAQGIMWSIGQENLFSFDGSRWTRWD
jgi:hypothetical protein